MSYSRYVLMNPGPVLVDSRVRQALNNPDLCHREPEFVELMTRIRDKLRLVCRANGGYSTVLFTGSGTAALEAVISSIVPETGKLLILSNGHYGERIARMAQVHAVAHAKLDFGWAAPLRLDWIADALVSDPRITHVAMVHHETSTGMLNSLTQVGRLVAHHRRSLVADAISSLGGEPLSLEDDCVDWCVGTANKCIESIPGVSFVCAPRPALEALAGQQSRSVYLDLGAHFVAQEVRKETLFTPAVQAMYALDVALDLLLQEGVAARNERYRALAQQLRRGLAARGFRFLLEDERDRSCLLTTLQLPEGCTYAAVHDGLKRRGFVIYAGQETLSHNFFRLSTMGQITHNDISSFLEALDGVLDEIRIRAAQ